MTLWGSYRENVVQRLRDLVESRGSSIYRIEKELNRGRGYVGDALRGDKKLSVELILEVLEVLRVNPEEFFDRPTNTSAAPSASPRLRSRERTAATTMLPPTMRNASTLLQAILVVLSRQGMLNLAEVEEAERELAREREPANDMGRTNVADAGNPGNEPTPRAPRAVEWIGTAE